MLCREHRVERNLQRQAERLVAEQRTDRRAQHDDRQTVFEERAPNRRAVGGEKPDGFAGGAKAVGAMGQARAELKDAELALGRARDLRARNFVAQATPVDFHEGGIFTTWTRPDYFNVDSMVDAHGNVPIDLMESGFSMMAPVQRLTKWLEVFRRVDDPEFVTTFLAMEAWAADNVPFPGELYRQYIKDCYQENNFFHGRMVVGGRTVDLANITCSLLTLIADKDTIAPPPSSLALAARVGSQDQTTMRFDVGHIGLSTSSKGPRLIWPKIAAWLAERSK